MDPAQASKLGRLGALVGESSKLVVVANFLMNLFIGGSLSEMFASINKLQIMVHLWIVNVKIPANA